jgi:hypothetical protein
MKLREPRQSWKCQHQSHFRPVSKYRHLIKDNKLVYQFKYATVLLISALLRHPIESDRHLSRSEGYPEMAARDQIQRAERVSIEEEQWSKSVRVLDRNDEGKGGPLCVSRDHKSLTALPNPPGMYFPENPPPPLRCLTS